ncbi:MAG TPA: type II secretion system protein GspK [Candidatus Hydrogenedens sp.]|nr:type II secretion system protein GspK [Candidatus Hydrogenedens sp.]
MKLKTKIQLHKRTGVAIILALVFIALLSIIVVEFLYEAEVEASLAYSQQGDLEAYLAAKSAVAKAMAYLAEDNLNTMMSGAPPVDSDFDLLSFNMSAATEPLNDALMHASISDEYGKINLNALLVPQSGGEPQERTPLVNALREFFALRDTGKGASPDIIVDSILDWLDYNEGDSERPQGAENDYYMGLENPYPCKNGPMDSIEELLLIKGITPEIYFGDPEKNQLPLSEYFTVHGDWLGRVNINSAQPEVIAAIVSGYTGNPADLGLGQRIFDDAHTQPFTDLSQLDAYGILPKPPTSQRRNTPQQAGKPIITPAERPDNRAQRYVMSGQIFTLQSNVFRIYGDGLYQNKMIRIEAYVFRNPMESGDFNNPGMNPNLNPANNKTNQQNLSRNTPRTNNNSTTVQNQGGLPPEPFRILDWKIIK